MKTTVTTLLKMLLFACLAATPLAAGPQVQTPAQPVPKQIANYIIGPTDLLQVLVFSNGVSQGEFTQRTYTVQNDGTITLPLLAQPLVISGKSIQQAKDLIRKNLIDAMQFTDPTIDITVLQYRSSSVTVQGAVRNQGRISLTAEKMTLNDVLNTAGGLQPSAGTRIRVKRSGDRPAEPGVLVEDGWEVYSKEDLNDGKLLDVKLYDDDRIDVEVAPKFYVNGYVKQSGDLQWEPGLTLEKALIKAGGVTSDGAKNRIEVKRFNPKTKVWVKIKKMPKDKMSLIIEPEDIITVPKRRM